MGRDFIWKEAWKRVKGLTKIYSNLLQPYNPGFSHRLLNLYKIKMFTMTVPGNFQQSTLQARSQLLLL